MKKMKCVSLLFFGIFVLFQHSFFVSASRADEIILIANPGVSADDLKKDEVERIFLGEKTKWHDGSRIIFVLLMTEDHGKFLDHYIGTTPTQYRHYWKKMVFIGRAKSPKSFRSAEKMLDYIAETEGSLGYIPLSAFHDKVKKITVR